MEWNCRKCGACCKSPFAKFWLPELWDEEKGQCMHLDNNQCKIYDTRPQQCRDIDYSSVPRGWEFKQVWCDFLNKHINKEAI